MCKLKCILLIVISLLISLALTSLTHAADTGPARSELERFVTDLDRFQSEFTQTVSTQDGTIQDQTQGEVWLQSPDKLRWIYTGDFPETIVADGDNIWIHDETLQQVTIKPQSDHASDSPLMILADASGLDQQFKVTELGDFNEMLLLELRSNDTESEFERILLGMDATGIRMMAMEDAFGQRTEINFFNTLVNAPANPQLFVFSPPEGTDVVGEVSLPD